MNDGAIISLAPGIILDYAGTPLKPEAVPTRVLPGAVASVPGPGFYAKPLPSLRGSYRVSFKVATPPLGILNTVVLGIGPNCLHVISVYDSGAIVAEAGYISPYYVCVTNAAVPDGTIVTATVAWDSTKPLDNGSHVKMRVDGGGEGSVVVFDSAGWDGLPLNSLYVGDASAVAPVNAYPEWVGRVQWSGRTDVF